MSPVAITSLRQKIAASVRILSEGRVASPIFREIHQELLAQDIAKLTAATDEDAMYDRRAADAADRAEMDFFAETGGN